MKMAGDASTGSRSFTRINSLTATEMGERHDSSVSDGMATCSDTTSTSNPTSSTLPHMSSGGDDMLGLRLQASPPQQSMSLSSPPPSFQDSAAPALTAPIPTLSLLQEVFASGRLPKSSHEMQVKWIRDVLFLVNRTCFPNTAVSAEVQVGPLVIDDLDLLELSESAVELLVTIVPSVPTAGTKLTPPIAEALYHRAALTSSGAFPDLLPENPRVAFRAFETSARAGHFASWFKLGRSYEAFDEYKRAKDCFERGAKAEDVSCLYRLGMAHLMGQLGLPVSPSTAVSLLSRAASKATIAVPQPAYVYASLLLGDFAHASANLPPSVFLPHIPPESTVEQEAQRFLERAAFLHFTPAQYKLGHFYEFARPPYAYDPLLSVQYYTLASEAEPEANLALSKWFLCGAEGFFEKDEVLARTFAERAARAGLASAEFAIGYYWEVGIGSHQDMYRAKRWYEKAAAHGNTDAADRLTSLAQNEESSLTRHDHDNLAEQTLVRRRTQAKQRSEVAGSVRRGGPRNNADQVVELVRRATRTQPGKVRRGRSSVGPERDVIPEQEDKGRRDSRGSREIDDRQQRHHADTIPATSLAPPAQFPEKKRYSLVDSGPTSRATSPVPQLRSESPDGRVINPPRRYASPSPARTSRTASEAGSSALSSVFSVSPIPSPGLERTAAASENGQGAPQRVKYNTFAEMGIQVSKAEEKECVIM